VRLAATPATIDDPAILDEVGDALQTIGYTTPSEVSARTN